MTTKKKVWFACGIPLGLVVLLFLWLALWANHWENKWETFKREAEAQGESFAYTKQWKPAVPDEENFLQHPWVKSVVDGNHSQLPTDREIRDLLDKVSATSFNDEETLSPRIMSEEWMNEVRKLLQEHEEDLESLCAASSRPDCNRNNPSFIESSNDATWQRISSWCQLLQLRCWYRWLTDDRSGMEADAKALFETAKHARSERIFLSVIIGAGIEGGLYELTKRDLNEEEIIREKKMFWLPLLSWRKESLVEEQIACMRCERNRFLPLLEKEIGYEGNFLAIKANEQIWQKNLFVQRVLLARNKLMLCEDLQQTIATPALSAEKVTGVNFEDFSKRIDKHRRENSLYGRVGLLCWLMTSKLYGGMASIEERRNDLIQQLSQSP